MVDNYREPEDLLSDESFLAWYYKTGQGEEQTWDAWISANPDNKELVQQAVELLNTTRIVEKPLPAQQVRRAEDALMQKIKALTIDDPITDLPAPAKQSVTIEQPSPVRSSLSPYRWIAAASIIILLGIGLFLSRNFLLGKPEVKTQYGQIIEQHLPDGTEVTMNANSKLSYSSDWKEGSDREVWVNGEAFFHVTKTPLKSRFIVHTDHFDVVVTGTQFNVVSRQNKANVMLKEGSITLYTRDGRTLQMLPGDFVAFDNSNQLEKKQVKDDSVLAWKEQKLVFNKTPLREVATIISEQYGIPVKLADDSIAAKTVCGMMPNNNLDVLLKALEATAEYDVIRSPDNDSITIKAHSHD